MVKITLRYKHEMSLDPFQFLENRNWDANWNLAILPAIRICVIEIKF